MGSQIPKKLSWRRRSAGAVVDGVEVGDVASAESDVAVYCHYFDQKTRL